MDHIEDLADYFRRGIIRRDIEMVKRCLNDGLDPNSMAGKKNLLMWAATMNFEEAVDILIKHDANLDVQDENGYTALMWACFNGKNECVTALVEAGADLEIMDNNRSMAIDHARRDGNKNLVNYLEPLNSEYTRAVKENKALEKEIDNKKSPNSGLRF